jgi:hypothetical protein
VQVVPGHILVPVPAAGALGTPQGVPATSGVLPVPGLGPLALASNPPQPPAALGPQASMQPEHPAAGSLSGMHMDEGSMARKEEDQPPVPPAAPAAAGVQVALAAPGPAAGGLTSRAPSAAAAAGPGAGPTLGSPLLLQSRSKQKRSRNSAGSRQQPDTNRGEAHGLQAQQQQGSEGQPEGDPFLALLLGKAPSKR